MCEGDAAGDPLFIASGYYARHRAVDAALRSFVRFAPAGQIVALGAGLDGSFWRLKATGCECAYFEVDSDLVVAEKQRLIRNHPILIEAVGQYAAGVSGAEDDRGVSTHWRRSAGYEYGRFGFGEGRLGCNEADAGFCECVLAYLDSDQGDSVVEWARATFVDVFVVCYDVVKTSKAFAKVMLDNFRARGAPLLGAAESLEDVEKRFGAFASRNVRDMRRVYDASSRPRRGRAQAHRDARDTTRRPRPVRRSRSSTTPTVLCDRARVCCVWRLCAARRGL